MEQWNQVSAANLNNGQVSTVRFWSAAGGTVASAIGQVIVADLQQVGAYNPGTGARASAGSTPNYTGFASPTGDATDFEANWVRPANASIAAQRLNRVGVIVANLTNPSPSGSTVANGDRVNVLITGRAIVPINGFSDDSTTGAAAAVGALLTLDGNASRLGALRVAASGERIVGRLLATAAGVTTGTVVASGASGTGVAEIFGDTIFRA